MPQLKLLGFNEVHIIQSHIPANHRMICENSENIQKFDLPQQPNPNKTRVI